MFKKADIVVANSSYLAEYAKEWNRNSYDIGQGCHLENFLEENLPVPDDMKDIPRPIIGYCGAITSMRLDIDVIKHIASSLPDCSIVLVGPADSFFENSNQIIRVIFFYLEVKHLNRFRGMSGILIFVLIPRR